MQFNLFQWDIMEAGNGYQSLTRLGCVGGRNHSNDYEEGE